MNEMMRLGGLLLILSIAQTASGQAVIRNGEVCYDSAYDNTLRRNISAMLRAYDSATEEVKLTKQLVALKDIELSLFKEKIVSYESVQKSADMNISNLKKQVLEQRRKTDRLKRSRLLYFAMGITASAVTIAILR